MKLRERGVRARGGVRRAEVLEVAEVARQLRRAVGDARAQLHFVFLVAHGHREAQRPAVPVALADARLE